MHLVVAIPCYNEAASVAQVVLGIPRAIDGVTTTEVVVIDDGSTDGSSVIARQLGASVVRHEKNMGLGVAFQSAMQYCINQRADMMVLIDADNQFDGDEIPLLISPVVGGRADMVIGSRFLDPSVTPNMPRAKVIGNKMMAWWISKLVRQKYFDVSCGFRCYSREALLRMTIQSTFTYTQEVFLDLVSKNLLIKEVPVHVRYFADRESRIAKSLFRYAVNTALIVLRGFRDYFPLRFFSYISLSCLMSALFFAAVLIAHFLSTGMFRGYLFAGVLAAFFVTLAIVFMIIGIIADMLSRMRSIQEEVLYLARKAS